MSWSCTGLDTPGDVIGCVRRLERQQVDLCIVVAELVDFAAAVSRANRLAVCLSHLAAG